MKLLQLLLILATLTISCNHLKEGKVIDSCYNAAHYNDYVTLQIVDNRGTTISVYHHDYVPASWELRIKGIYKNKERIEWHYVNEADYLTARIGDSIKFQ